MNRDASELVRRCAMELGIELSADELERFAIFADELKKWNKKINLTAIRDDRDIALKHFADSLTLLSSVKKTGSLLDLGSGGGFPAIPLKIMLPSLSVISVDAVEKKILFQRQAARLLQLHGFTALHARGEELPRSYPSHFDCVVSRAFSDLPYFVSLALPLLKNDGHIIAMKGREGRDEAVAAKSQLFNLGATVIECIHLKLPFANNDRYLVVMGKIGAESAGENIQFREF